MRSTSSIVKTTGTSTAASSKRSSKVTKPSKSGSECIRTSLNPTHERPQSSGVITEHRRKQAMFLRRRTARPRAPSPARNLRRASSPEPRSGQRCDDHDEPQRDADEKRGLEGVSAAFIARPRSNNHGDQHGPVGKKPRDESCGHPGAAAHEPRDNAASSGEP